MPPEAWRFDAALIVLGAVLVALAADVAIPVPGSPVPITGQSFAALVIGGLWGRWLGAATLGLYLLLGSAGMPVFAGGAVGLGHLVGPTGGYLLGLVVAAWTAGWLVERWTEPPLGGASVVARLARVTGELTGAMILASVPLLALGCLRLAAEVGWSRAWAVGAEPFLLGAAIKALLAAAVVAAALRRAAVGVLLFLFIPLVLWLLVGQPELPAERRGWCLAAALVLMLGHRFIARPYMVAVSRRRCVWCCRAVSPEDADEVRLDATGGPVATLACRLHRESAGRFFGCLEGARVPLAMGIFLPLLALLAALAVTAVGWRVPLTEVTAGFRLTIGLTVVAVSAFFPLAEDRQAAQGRPPRVPFPIHTFFLIGVRALLWVFRLIGAWWIVQGARELIA